MATEQSRIRLYLSTTLTRASFGTFRKAFSYSYRPRRTDCLTPQSYQQGKPIEEMSMYKSVAVLVAGVLLGSGAAFGKLPPPSAEEQAAAATKKAAEQAQLEQEKALLEKAQDRIVARYRSESSTRQQAAGGRTSDQNMPKTTSELPRGTGPDPVRPQSAEAHSAPAK